jgi:hypothetical protein
MSEMKFFGDWFGGFDGLFVDILNERITSKDRQEMARNLQDWLAVTARKKPLPDLENRMQRMNERMAVLAERATFVKEDEEIVVKAAGEADETLKMLERGTDWFDPCESVVSVMISALGKS